eukprot:385963_1
MLKSILTNMYCRWIGFNHSSINITKDSLYTMSDKVLFETYKNAVDLLLQIDFVLPFSKWMQPNFGINRLNNSIWFILLNKIIPNKFSFKVSQSHKNILFWDMDRNSENEIELLSSKDVMKFITIADLEVIQNYNSYDIRLYELAKNIEKMDMHYFHSQYST